MGNTGYRHRVRTSRRRRLLLIAGIAGIAGISLAGALAYSEQTAESFARSPGFVAYYAAKPPSDDLPTAAERDLLQRSRPRIFLSPENARPISFYDDYIAFGALRGGSGSNITRDPTREQLNALRGDPGARFEHQPGPSPTQPIVFARIDRDTLAEGGERQRELTFLTYNLVFRTSGLPAGVPTWLGWLAKKTGWDRDWHQLDNFTAATIVLDEARTPLALMLQQHHLEIKDNETFAVRYEIPVPVIGRWRATGRQVLFVGRDAIVAFEGGKEVERVPLPPPPEGEDPQSIARRHILVRDVDADGRLDMVVVQAKGAMRLFSVFEGVAAYFRGAVYDFEKKRFRAPSVRKVPGALLRPALVDVDGDRDLDLVLSTVQTSGLGAVTGKAPGVSYLFLFEDGDFSRRPGWTYKTFVPMANLGVVPHSPVTFLPDLDGNGFGELIDQSNGVLLAHPPISAHMRYLPQEYGPPILPDMGWCEVTENPRAACFVPVIRYSCPVIMG